MTTMKKEQVCIVGAGPGGLSTAILLASQGCEVTVLEKLPWVGGRTSVEEISGFRFDRGPTFFLYPRVLREILASAGYDLDREIELERLDPQYRLTFGEGGELRATPDVARMEQEIARIAPEDAKHFSRYLSDNRRKLRLMEPILASSFSGWRDLMRRELVQTLPVLRPWNSVERELRRYFSDARIRLAFSFQSKYLGMSPFRCPSLFSILSFLEYEHGVFHPKGGCGALTEMLARIACELGVEVRTSEPVQRLEFRGKRVVGAHTASGFQPCDRLVMNADFAQAMMTLVPEHLRKRWSDRKIRSKRYSCSTFMLYLGIEGMYPDVPHHNIYIAKDYAGNLAQIEEEHRLSPDPSFYVQNACVTDPSLAPAGCSTLYVLVPVTHNTGSVNWSKEAPAFRRLVLAQLEKIGIHDVENRIRVEKMYTPDDWTSQFELHLGSTFSMAHTLNQMLHLRPHNRFEDLDGVYLVGGGTHPGSGLPVIFESARITSKLLLADAGLADRREVLDRKAPVPELSM